MRAVRRGVGPGGRRGSLTAEQEDAVLRAAAGRHLLGAVRGHLRVRGGVRAALLEEETLKKGRGFFSFKKKSRYGFRVMSHILEKIQHRCFQLYFIKDILTNVVPTQIILNVSGVYIYIYIYSPLTHPDSLYCIFHFFH